MGEREAGQWLKEGYFGSAPKVHCTLEMVKLYKYHLHFLERTEALDLL